MKVYGFLSSAKSAFSFLSELGYVAVEESSKSISLQANQTRVEVSFNSFSHEVDTNIVFGDSYFDLYDLLEFADEAEAKSYRVGMATSLEAMSFVLKRDAQILAKHGKRALEGDRRFFLELDRFIEARRDSAFEHKDRPTP